jgi:lipopolysaccharide biosynthesis protein
MSIQPRKRYSVHKLRHPQANFGQGEWWRAYETDSLSNARDFVANHNGDNEKYRIYSGMIIIN